MSKPFIVFICIFFLIPESAFSGDEMKRSKSLHFEDDLIEGINRKNLDSVNQISERDSQNLKHLYQKRSAFWDQDQELILEMELKP